MIDLRIFNGALQVLGFQGGLGDVEPVEVFRAYLSRAQALNDALVRADEQETLRIVEKRKDIDSALDVLCGGQLREDINGSQL
jgi:hypothetical protein